jgi:hypothetical protein
LPSQKNPQGETASELYVSLAFFPMARLGVLEHTANGALTSEKTVTYPSHKTY